MRKLLESESRRNDTWTFFGLVDRGGRINTAARDVVPDRRLTETRHLAGDEYTIADIAAWPWYGMLVQGELYDDASTFLSVHEYKNVQRWAASIAERPAVKRGRLVNRTTGEPSSQGLDRHVPRG